MLKRLEADEGARANGQHSVEIIGLGVHASSVRARKLSERLGYESIQTLHGLTHGVTPDCQSKESKSEEPHREQSSERGLYHPCVAPRRLQIVAKDSRLIAHTSVDLSG